MFNNPIYVSTSLFMYGYLYYKSNQQLDSIFCISQNMYREDPLAWNLIIIFNSFISIGSGYLFLYTLSH